METKAYQAEAARHEKENKAFEKEIKTYLRNISIIMLPFSIIMLAAGLALADKLPVIPNGILLGGVFTLFSSITMGLQSESDKFRFLIVGIGLVVAIVIGYLKFISPMQKKTD